MYVSAGNSYQELSIIIMCSDVEHFK